MVKEKIVEENKKLGIKTFFYKDNNGLLGYSEGKSVYLNEAYMSRIELVNKHEVLHFFETSKQFRMIKKLVFELLSEDEINNLRNRYYLKYSSLYDDYSLIDNEIVIDMIVGNGVFSININDYYNSLYSFIVNKENVLSVSGKRYLNLSVSNKVLQQFSELTKWEKIFVINYYSNGENILPSDKNTKYKEIRSTIEEELNNLYLFAQNKENFTISIDSKELLREYEVEIKKLLSRNETDEADVLINNKDKALRKLADKYSESLYAEYNHLVNLIKETNYEPSFKYLMLKETLTKTYRQIESEGRINNIVEKRDLSTTIKSHMNFNDTVLGVIYNHIEDYSNFANLYFAGLSLLNKTTYEKNKVSLNGVNTFNMGRWIRFEGKKNNSKTYIKNAQELSAMVQDTPWCTKNEASLHLEEGDFYLFVDNDNKPHIGIKLIGDKIDEVRGIKNGNAQEMEEEYRDVALEFLIKNKNIKFGKEWIEKEEWNKRLVEYSVKIDKGKLNKEDIDALVHDLTEVKDYKAHYAQCGNRLILLNKIGRLKVIKKMLAQKYNCSPRKIFIGNISKKDIKNNKFPYEVVLGNIDLDYLNKNVDFSSLRIVLGNLTFSYNTSKGFENLELVRGSFNVSNSNLEDIDKLVSIGEIGDFYDSKIKKMSSLVDIGGAANFIFAKIDDLSSLKFIGEEGRFEYSNISDLSKLELIVGNANFKNSTIAKMGDFKCEGKLFGLLTSNIRKVEKTESRKR